MSKTSIELLELELCKANRMRDQYLESVNNYQKYADSWALRVQELKDDILVLKRRLNLDTGHQR